MKIINFLENKIGVDVVERKNGFLRENSEMKIRQQKMTILKLNELGVDGGVHLLQDTLCRGGG